jgi:hypothetical protein
VAEERRYPSSRQSKGGFIFQVAAGCSSATDVAARINPSFIATPYSELIPSERALRKHPDPPKGGLCALSRKAPERPCLS